MVSERKLAKSVLKWWEEHKDDKIEGACHLYYIYEGYKDGDWVIMEPEFVKIAKAILKK